MLIFIKNPTFVRFRGRWSILSDIKTLFTKILIKNDISCCEYTRKNIISFIYQLVVQYQNFLPMAEEGTNNGESGGMVRKVDIHFSDKKMQQVDNDNTAVVTYCFFF